MSKTVDGILLIADISGYTGYLNQTELEHAQEVLTALLEVLITHTRPPLIISRTAGDAVISYSIREGFYQTQTFVELIDDTYIAFRKAVEHMARNNNCQCNACRMLPSLDLKFFVHTGVFGLQNLSGHSELIGPDVNLIHRLLKNRIKEDTGITAYTLFTESAINNLGMEEMIPTLVAYRETYPDVGEVLAWIKDMHGVWQAKMVVRQVIIAPEDINLQTSVTINLPLERVWDYLIQPAWRKILLGTDDMAVVHKNNGMIDESSLYHCYHGDKIIPQTILEWRPFEVIVIESQIELPLIKASTIQVEYLITPDEQGTRLTTTYSKAHGPWIGRLLINRSFAGSGKEELDNLVLFKKAIEEDAKINN